MAFTTHQNIMGFVKGFIKDFASKAGNEQLTELALSEWEKQSEKVKEIIDVKTSKKSSTKDPNKPKRGRSAYIFYCQENRVAVKEEMPEAKGPDVTRELGARWRALKESPTAKDKRSVARYEKMSVEDKQRYEEEIANYQAPSEEELLANKPKRGRKSTKPKSTKPKRGKSAYIFFSQEMRPILKKELDDAKEVTSKISELWAELKDDEDREDELEKYNELARRDKERFEKEMEDYEPPEDEEPPKKKTRTSKTATSTKDKEGFKKFCAANRQELKEENPGLKATEITKLLKEEWKEIDEEEKEQWFNEEQE